MNFSRPQRCYDPVTIGALVGTAVWGGYAASTDRDIVTGQKKDKMKTSVPGIATVESPKVAADEGIGSTQANRIGRAALIATSPLGVLSTEPTGRRKILGN